jgi:lipopolysaccharide/colanic/teichoic acid biosynthesis glycosyltransferase
MFYLIHPGAQGAGAALDRGRLIQRRDLDISLRIYLAAKGAVDVVASLLGIVLFSPLWALIALAIKLDSPGPVVFRQKRPGQWGVTFDILKFRTMAQDAEKHLDTILAVNPEKDGSLIRVPDDPRVTRLGRLLRKLSLDETPQFINILRGEMSLVGPRPISRPIPDPRGLLRLEARPGLTGLWQINGRKDTNCQFMLEKDMEYLQRRCLSLDFAIMLSTLGVLLRPKGAR